MTTAFAPASDVQTPQALLPRVLSYLKGPVGSIALMLAAVVIIGAISVGPAFFSASNVRIVGVAVAIPLIVGVLASFALLAGVVDLSIGSMVGFGAVAFNQLVASGIDPWMAAGVTVLLGVVVGSINAFVIVGLGAEPLAVTLGMLTLLRGVCQAIVVQAPPTTLIEPLYDVTQGTTLGIPTLLLIGVGLTLVAAGVVSKTRIGRKVQAVGGDPRAAQRAGISVVRVRTVALIVSAVGAAIGGIFYVGQLGSASNILGTGLEFQIYAALMIGGYSITRGGVGNPIGALLGLLVVAGITNILNVSFIDPDYLDLIVAVILLAAVLVDRFRGGDAFE
ncbi:ABC transporter permease [Microbacterium foliorum]|uniref:Autoinducer 2 import system permease protein LsrD n=1 Tax=Microbacterium foliorum TaxID=104336 RepID=A0A4Y5YTG2_9MICO|nr:ABC transporter permease [Microbacterium foliorum]QDE36074.1 ABC transporter permease [Microbacterium foliorum]